MKIFALKKGDNVVQKILEYIENEQINSGAIYALGALESATVMIYNLKTKQYSEKSLKGPLEVASFSAVISKDPEGKNHIHPHIVISDDKFQTFGGHLKEAIVGATLEVIIISSDQALNRYADSEIGLNLLK